MVDMGGEWLTQGLRFLTLASSWRQIPTCVTSTRGVARRGCVSDLLVVVLTSLDLEFFCGEHNMPFTTLALRL